MTPKRGATDLSGVLPVDKPAGVTSHDVVNVVRRVTGERRVGHAGTLDPSATGLLVVLVGPATRLAPYLTGAEKTYEARIVFGSETDTDDGEGAVTRTAPVPPALSDERVAREALANIVGVHEQVPPAYSAIKVDGRTAHRVARGGGEVRLEPRRIEVLEAELLSIASEDELTYTVRFVVSKGTYVRALARDLGRALGTAAHLGGLRRTRSGALTIEDAHQLSEVEDAGPSGVEHLFVDAVTALGLPAIELSQTDAEFVAHGTAIDAAAAAGLGDGPIALTRMGRLLAVYEKRGGRLSAAVVFPGSVATP